MPGPEFHPEFLDTNVLVYAYDASAPKKQRIAQDLVRRAAGGDLVISSQVLAEFSATLLHKLKPPASTSDVIALLDALAPIPLITPTHDIVRRAVEAHAAYGIHFFDGMIVASAEHAGCKKIWSEDLSAGQEYFGIQVVNPFSG